MRGSILFVSLGLVASPATADPALVANGDGSVTLTVPIDSTPPPVLLEQAPRLSRNAARVRSRAEAEAEIDRAFKEATAEARDAARTPRPH